MTSDLKTNSELDFSKVLNGSLNVFFKDALRVAAMFYERFLLGVNSFDNEDEVVALFNTVLDRMVRKKEGYVGK